MDEMTDNQFNKFFQMVLMILDGCKDIDEEKAKVNALLKDDKQKEND